MPASDATIGSDAGCDVVPARDEMALAREINNLFDNPEQLQRMSREGIQRVEKLFNWGKAVSQMVEIYESCIEKMH